MIETVSEESDTIAFDGLTASFRYVGQPNRQAAIGFGIIQS